jgi:hypothetical protein
MRKFLVGLVLLAVLLLAADFGARAYAESVTADAVQAELGTTTAPDVSIEGFPFLFHAVRGEYPQVIVTAVNIDDGRLPGTRAILALSDVSLPLGDALAGNTSQLAAQTSILHVLVPLSSLSAAVGQPNLTLSAAADGGLAVTTSVDIAGRQIPLSGTATITVTNDTMTLSVRSLAAAGIDLTRVLTAASDAVAGDLSRSFPLPGLPFTVTQADVSVAGDDLVLTATTGYVRLSDLR